ncbi:MAG: protein translocase SEC61 complex subunit gamma [Candidatus Anstonellales archaeon]
MIGSWIESIKKTIAGVRRVLIVSTKPTPTQLRLVIKVSGLGMIAIGLLGLLISVIASAGG